MKEFAHRMNQTQLSYAGIYNCIVTCNWLLHPAPTNAQDGLDLLQVALHGGS